MNQAIDKTEKSSTGLDANIAGLVCYLVGFITGILFLAVEKKSRFVRFHAMQSTGVFITLFVISVVLGFLPLGVAAVLSTLISLLALVVWIFMMYKAYSWEAYRLPVFGDMAAKELEKPLAG